jgi:hypothetical protein
MAPTCPEVPNSEDLEMVFTLHRRCGMGRTGGGMMRAVVAALGFSACAGCFGFEDRPADNFFLRPNPPANLPPMNPASTEAAARVDCIGRRILSANPQLAVHPMFRTIGAPQAEVFHRGTTDIMITEGLVRQCTSDGQLAAVLCTELGKAVAEREINTPASTRQPDRSPPIDPGLGRDSALGYSPDLTRLRELADYETPRQQRAQPVAPPDAAAITRVSLLRAGFHDADLQAAGPLLQAANGNNGLEKQLVPPG